jgi:hypothetical protein
MSLDTLGALASCQVIESLKTTELVMQPSVFVSRRSKAQTARRQNKCFAKYVANSRGASTEQLMKQSTFGLWNGK